jgi:hypothetical protein
LAIVGNYKNVLTGLGQILGLGLRGDSLGYRVWVMDEWEWDHATPVQTSNFRHFFDQLVRKFGVTNLTIPDVSAGTDLQLSQSV